MGSPSAFRQRDVTRAIRAAQAAGMTPHVWIGKDGAIHIAPLDVSTLTAPAPEASSDAAESQWDAAFD